MVQFLDNLKTKRTVCAVSVLLCIVLIGLIVWLTNQSTQIGNNSNAERSSNSLFTDDFEDGIIIDASRAWKTKQLQRGSVTEVVGPVNTENTAVQAIAGKRIEKEVGKADLIKELYPVPYGSTLIVTADFYFPAETTLDSIHLIDVECASCGIDTNPGVRLYVRDGRLRIDRSKIAIADSINQFVDVSLVAGKWHTIRWEIDLGMNDEGRSQVFLDAEQVINQRGSFVLTPETAQDLGLNLVQEYIDRVQIGITANSNDSEQTLYFDNVSIEVLR